jgi:hypothetical protein
VEIWFGIFQRKTLQNASFSSFDQLVETIHKFTAAYNQNGNPIHTGRFHRYGLDAKRHQPVSHAFEIRREGLKGLHRFTAEIRGVNSRLYKAIPVAAQCGHWNRAVMRPVKSRRNQAT